MEPDKRTDKLCEHTTIRHDLAIQAHSELITRQRRYQKVEQILPTGCVIEELEDRADLRVKCFHAQQKTHLLGHGSCLNKNPLLLPILLRASNGQRARNFVVPPRQSDEHHFVRTLHRQSIHMPIYHLTPSEEIPVNICHYEVSSMCHYATKLFITSSPIFTVHYEICPPCDKVEEFTNSRLQNTSDLVLRPSVPILAQPLTMTWRNTKLATSYGIHSAVQRTIVAVRTQNVKKLKVHKQRSQQIQSEEYTSRSIACERVLLKAPEKQSLKLCSMNDTDKEPRKVTEVVIEEQFYDAVDTCDISIVSSHSVEICSNPSQHYK